MRARLEELVALLRRDGVTISLAEAMDAARAVAVVGVERAALREALAATLVKDERDRASFLAAFDAVFPARVEVAAGRRRRSRRGGATGEGGGGGAGTAAGGAAASGGPGASPAEGKAPRTGETRDEGAGGAARPETAMPAAHTAPLRAGRPGAAERACSFTRRR